MSDTTPPSPDAPRRRVWPRLLLVASLTFNILVIAAVAGSQLRDGRDARRVPPERSASRDGGFIPFFDAMPRAARDRMLDAVRARGVEVGPDRAALAADFGAFVAALKAEPFDAAALDAVLAAQHERIGARVTAGRELLVEQVAAMTEADRLEFAAAMETRLHEAMSRMSGKPGGDHGPGH